MDSREQNPLYAYSEPGRYEVLLTTEETQYPVRHTIEVLPQYAENDSTDVLVVIGNDIREHLQAIVDGKPVQCPLQLYPQEVPLWKSGHCGDGQQ